MNKILQQIANTIIANLANTEPIGLFNGKIGLCLFLYRYARYSGSAIYEDIASQLLDDVFNQLKPEMSPSMIDGLGGIGYALSSLLGDHLVESDPEDHILVDIDNALLGNTSPTLISKNYLPTPLYAPGMYLVSRISDGKAHVEPQWTINVIEQAILIVTDCINQQQNARLSLSSLNSMLYVFQKLSINIKPTSSKLDGLLRGILDLSLQAIHNNSYQEIDILLLRQNIIHLPQTLQTEYRLLAELAKEIKCFANKSRIDVWYNHLWWSILYDTPIIKDISFAEIECYVDNKVQECYFDDLTINNKLAAAGLWLMRNYNQSNN